MKQFFIFLSAAFVLFVFTHCENSDNKNKNKEMDVTSDLSDEPASMDIDYSNPARVVEVIFEVANSMQFEKLNNLCDPLGQNNESSQAICELADSEKEKFVEYFKKGSISGDIKIINDTAWVPILFGIEGNKPDVIKLIERNKKWFIIDF